MSRYIDADALIEAMGEEPYVWNDEPEEIAERNQWLTDMHIIENAPTIDIVPCRECRRVREDGGHANCNGYLYCRKWKTLVNEDSYCSWGERRDE